VVRHPSGGAFLHRGRSPGNESDMKKVRVGIALALAAGAASLPACSGKTGSTYGKYDVVGTYYDETVERKAKDNAADVLTKLGGEPNVCLVGLWAYNPPAILSAVRDAGKLGRVRIVGFDEHENTLQGIRDGHIYATVVQQPYEFGYQSVKTMARLAREANPPPPKPKVGFVSNNAHEFWTIAEAGARKAEGEFDAELVFKRPQSGTAAEQKQIIEDLLAQGVNAIAVSVIDPDNQHDFLNRIAERVPLITQDNDAPKTRRKFYIGTDNYAAGREVGKLIKEAMPDGGKVAIFVGQADPLNARERRAGVLDELAGNPAAPQGEGPGVIHVPHKVIKKDNVEEFHQKLRQLLGKD
jgi:ribose transport system substrate-binding protein